MSASKPVSLSQAFTELEHIVQEFEGGQLDLETYIPKFKRAVALAKHLKTELKKIDSQIEEINLEFEAEDKTPPPPAAEPSNQDDIPF